MCLYKITSKVLTVVKHQLGPGQLLWAAGMVLVTHRPGVEGLVCADWPEGKKAMELKHGANSDVNS